MIALVDCNNFYVSCERAFNPSLVGKPVVVLSNNDGCVISRSNEAKDIGIPMGAPTHQISYEVKTHNVAVFSSNYELYGDMSNRIMALLKELSPRVENYSIDEAFLHLDVVDNLEAFAEKIKHTILKGTGIPVTIGIAPTKTLAKVANKAAKKLNGISILDTPEKIEQSLKDTPIEAVWGIGWSLSKKLIQYNIKTAYLFSQMSPEWVKKTMSITGLRTQQELKGIACIDEENQFTEKKMICTSRSFGKFQSDITEIEEAVAFFASSCAEKLRKQKSCAGVITVFLQTNFHNKTIEQHSSSHTICMPVATQASNEIIHYALLALEKVYAKGFAFKKAGVIVSAIIDESTVQTHLFDTADRDKQTKTMQLMDKINKQYGAGKLKMAVQGNKTGWQLKREKLSKSYSTDWKQLIEIK